VDEEGNFLRNLFQLHSINKGEVRRELEAQLLKARAAGVCVTHFDSHHHVHMTTSLRKVFALISSEHEVPMRRVNATSRNPMRIAALAWDLRNSLSYTEKFSADFYGEDITYEALRRIIRSFRGKTLEIMCHPGYADIGNGVYNTERETELKILTDDRLKNLLLTL
jgi:hypothetical protein